LAEAAVTAERPVWIIGRPFAPDDRYAHRFLEFARKHSDYVRYEGPINDRAKLAEAYRQARGFVLLSGSESLSLSALEAAACGCPLLLSDLPWARCTFEDKATYCPVGSRAKTAAILRRFYDHAPQQPSPPRPLSWPDVAKRLKGIYKVRDKVSDKGPIPTSLGQLYLSRPPNRTGIPCAARNSFTCPTVSSPK
jgi:glycosyltransferase involved in cell wall biosynthesis